MDLEKCIIIFFNCYSVKQSSFAALNLLYAPPTHSFTPSLTLATTDHFISIILPLSECHIAGARQYEPFHTSFFHVVTCIQGFSMCFHDIIARFFLVMNIIPLSRYTTVYLCLHLPKDTLVTSKIWKHA